MTRRVKGLFVIGFVAVALIAGWLVINTSKSVQELPDGSVLRLEGAVFGTNEFVWGTPLEKALARWLPPSGIQLFGLQLKKPTHHSSTHLYGETLQLWFTLSGPVLTRHQINDHWDQNYRVIAFNEHDRQFENPVAGFAPVSSNRYVGVFSLTAFPKGHEEGRPQIPPARL